MQLRTLPSPGTPPADGLVAHVLLVGGNDRDLQTFRNRLEPLSIGVPWQWANVTAGHRQFPRCDAVIIFTHAVAHSLYFSVSAQAKTRRVPIIAHDTWPKTLLALDQAKIGTHPLKETPVPTPDPARLNTSSMDDAIKVAHSAWDALPAETRAAVATAARNANEHNKEPMPQVARDFLRKYVGNPRAFVATVILATPGVEKHMTQSSCARFYRDVAGKKAEPAIVSAVAQRVAKLHGSAYGLRKGEPFDLRTSKTPAPVVQTPSLPAPITPIVETPPMPVSVPKPVSAPPSNLARARFERMLHAALDAGETVTATRIDNTYTLTYEDGTIVTVRSR